MSRPPLMALDDALAALLAQAAAPLAQEEVSTFDADGRVLAQDIVSALQVPAFDNSAMDGYALRCADVAAAGTALPVALHAGYQLAFGLAAVAALVATALGLVLRPTAMPAEGAAAAH